MQLERRRAVMLIDIAGRTTAKVIRELRGIPAFAHYERQADFVAYVRAASLAQMNRLLHETLIRELPQSQ